MQPLSISSIKITPFNLALHPLTVAGRPLARREGYHVEVAAGALTSQGEASPLPGFSAETLKKARHDLEETGPRLAGWEVPTEKSRLIDAIKNHPDIRACCASARFAIESAVFLLAAQAQGRSLAQFLGAGKALPSAVLLQGGHDEVVRQAKEMKGQGRTVFKLKVGDRNIPLDVKKVQSLRQAAGAQAVIRLDANRAWKMEEALLFAQLAGNDQIEFIEEPLKDMDRLADFYKQARMPAALDESLAAMRCAVSAPGRCLPAMTAQDAVGAYVIKPMVLGGVVCALEWIAEAARLDKQAVISSAFESPVGHGVLKDLAGLTKTAPGLDTQKYLA